MTNSRDIQNLDIEAVTSLSLTDSSKHTFMKPVMKGLVLNCCNLYTKNLISKEERLNCMRTILLLIRFSNIHLYLCRKDKSDYYCSKLNKILYTLSFKITNYSKTDTIYKIKKAMAVSVVELEKIRLEEEINKEFIYIKEDMPEEQSKKIDKENIDEIDNYFTNTLPSEESEMFEFLGI